MREIKFRGINNDGNWCFGDLIQSNNDHNVWIHAPKINHTYKVAPATVGQFTGIKDISGAEIYEGDIITFKDCETDEYVPGVVGQSDEGTWWVKCVDFRVPLWNVRKTALILSNIHDAPELLEGKDA